MTRFTGRLVAGAMGVACLFAAAPAAADEAIARRLGALRSLVKPITARPATPADSEDPAGACPSGTWWRLTEYGVNSRIEKAVRDAALRFGVDPGLIRSVIRHESAGNIHAVSHRGAQGLMQLMPATAHELGVVCPFDPRENVLGGTRYLRTLRDRFASWPRALAAYHAGPARVDSGRIPGETRRYVRRVVGSWRPERLATLRID